MADWTGQAILGYRVVAPLGSGGMATVWKAEHPDLGRAVAIKVLSPELAAEPGLVDRFVQEARIQVELHHPNIVRVENFAREPLAILMEYVPGRTLADVIGREVGPIPIERALPYIRQILAALGHAHERGVVHRDLKPSNVLVREDGAVKVMDFGIAKVFGGAKLTRTGMGMGTAAYMSPEQIRAPRDVDARSDVYSLGVTFYEMLAGRAPFESDEDTGSDFEVRMAHISQPPPDPRTFYPAIPEAIVRVVLRALAKDPGERFPSCAEFGAAIEAAANGAGLPHVSALSHTGPASPPPQPGPPSTRQPAASGDGSAGRVAARQGPARGVSQIPDGSLGAAGVRPPVGFAITAGVLGIISGALFLLAGAAGAGSDGLYTFAPLLLALGSVMVLAGAFACAGRPGWTLTLAILGTLLALLAFLGLASGGAPSAAIGLLLGWGLLLGSGTATFGYAGFGQTRRLRQWKLVNGR